MRTHRFAVWLIVPLVCSLILVGVVLAEASADREEILLAEIDLARIEDVRRNWPFLRDRRIDAYAGITNRFRNEEPWRK